MGTQLEGRFKNEPFKSCGFLHSSYFLDDCNTKHVRVGFFQNEDLQYSLQILFVNCNNIFRMSFEEFSTLYIHLNTINECMSKKLRLTLELTPDISLVCLKQRLKIRRKNNFPFHFSGVEWSNFEVYTPTLLHTIQKLYIHEPELISYSESLIAAGSYINPPNLNLDTERIFYELQNNGYLFNGA